MDRCRPDAPGCRPSYDRRSDACAPLAQASDLLDRSAPGRPPDSALVNRPGLVQLADYRRVMSTSVGITLVTAGAVLGVVVPPPPPAERLPGPPASTRLFAAVTEGTRRDKRAHRAGPGGRDASGARRTK